jgi:transposase
MSYSVDFRECVVKNIHDGMLWDDACRIFSVSRERINRWLTMASEGNLSDAPRKEYKTRKVDKTTLKMLIETHPDATLQEISNHFQTYPSVIDYHFKKMGITRKKNHALRGEKRRKKA